MKSIKVLVGTEKGIDISKLSLEERAIIFEKISNENNKIPAEIFARFLESTNDQIHRELQLDRPTIAEILTKRIILLSASLANEFLDSRRINMPNSILPIIMTSADMDNMDTVNIVNANTTNIIGGAIPILRHALKPKYAKSTKQSIKIRFDRPILSLDMKSRPYISTSNEDLYVVGLHISARCVSSPQYSGNMQNPREYRKISNLLSVGSYNWKDIFDSCDTAFEKSQSGNIGNIDISNTDRTSNNNDISNNNIQIVDSSGPKMDVLNSIFQYAASLIDANASAGLLYHRMIDLAIASIDMKTYTDNTDNTDNTADTIINALVPVSNTKVSIVKLTRLTPEDGILFVLESLNAGRFCKDSVLALTADLYGRGFNGIFYSSNLAGMDSTVVNNLLDKYRSRKEKSKFAARVKLERVEKEARNSTMRMLITRKLSVKRVAEITAMINKNRAILQTDGLLSMLTKEEKKIIEAEYIKLIKYSAEVIGNKCPHVNLVRRLRTAKDDYSAAKILSELRVMYANATKTANAANATNTSDHMIKCKLCGFDIICPHVDVLYSQDSTHIKSALTKYIAHGQSDIHCKICGESMATVDALEGIEVDHSEDSYRNDELKNFIWSEVAINMKYFKFSPMVDVNKVITRVRDSIYDYVSDIETQILKSKTTSAEELKAKKRLFTTIYAFAQMIHLVMSNIKTGSVKFRDQKLTDPRKAIAELIRKSLDLIMISRMSIIREIPGMTVDVIKNNLISAYKIVQTGKLEELRDNDPGDLSIEFDPVFNSAVSIEVLRMLADGKNVNYENVEEKLRMRVIGSQAGSKKNKNCTDDGLSLFKDVVSLLSGRAFSTEMFYNLEAPHGQIYVSSDGKSSKNKKLIYEAAMPGYIAASYNIVVKQVLRKLYNMHSSMSAEVHAKENALLEAEFAKLRTAEEYLFRYRDLKYARGYTDPTGGLQRKYSNPDVSIARIYDENGEVHKFNIWISDNGKSRTEFTSRDIAKQLESGKRFNSTITDKKCSTCGVLWSAVDTLNVDKIRESLNAQSTLDNFFRFYESRCPRGELHVYKSQGDESVCEKCGMRANMQKGKNSMNIMNIYRQYKSAYIRDRDELMSSVVPDVIEAKAPRDTSSIATEYEAWVPNFSAVVALSEKLKINQRLFLAMGATERIEYTEIENGKYIPPETEERSATRVYTLNAYIRSLYIEWSQLRTFYRLLKPNSELANLIESSGINRADIHEVMASLPDVYDDFSLRFEHVQWKLKPRDVVSFCIQTFCEKCLTILDQSNHSGNKNAKSIAKISTMFVEYIVAKILRNDELMSKPGYFSWSIIFGDKDSKEDVVDNDGEGGPDAAPPADDTGEEVAFSMEAFDVEDDTGDMPDDDPGNQIRVEGLGLD